MTLAERRRLYILEQNWLTALLARALSRLNPALPRTVDAPAACVSQPLLAACAAQPLLVALHRTQPLLVACAAPPVFGASNAGESHLLRGRRGVWCATVHTSVEGRRSACAAPAVVAVMAAAVVVVTDVAPSVHPPLGLLWRTFVWRPACSRGRRDSSGAGYSFPVPRHTRGLSTPYPPHATRGALQQSSVTDALLVYPPQGPPALRAPAQPPTLVGCHGLCKHSSLLPSAPPSTISYSHKPPQDKPLLRSHFPYCDGWSVASSEARFVLLPPATPPLSKKALVCSPWSATVGGASIPMSSPHPSM